MSQIARAVLVGNLTRDPELNSTGKILKLGLAVNRSVKRNDEWTDEVSYFDITVFGNRAQALAKILAKGRPIAVDAVVVQERWENQAGETRSAICFYADEVQLLGSRDDAPRSDIPSEQPVMAVLGSSDDEIPFLHDGFPEHEARREHRSRW